MRWGSALHDRFLLPYYLWRDFEDVLAHLAARGSRCRPTAYRPVRRAALPARRHALSSGDVALEVRNAIEPWHVLGEEATAAGTSRYVDSSMERIEVRAHGLIAERHRVLVNGHALPLTPTAEGGRVGRRRAVPRVGPPHACMPHLGIHHPLRIDLSTRGASARRRCAYHVWHPEGRAFDAPPLTRFEAAARRAQRFTTAAPLEWPVRARPVQVSGEAPAPSILRRLPIHRPPPAPVEEEEGGRRRAEQRLPGSRDEDCPVADALHR